MSLHPIVHDGPELIEAHLSFKGRGRSQAETPNPSLHPKCYSGLRPLPHSGELKR
jgi:hypothetical protein